MNESACRYEAQPAHAVEKKETKLNSPLQSRVAAAAGECPRVFWCPDLVSTRDLGRTESKLCCILPELMKARPADFRSALAGKQMVMFFEKPSLRTRLTFEAGMASLGGTAIFVDQTHEPPRCARKAERHRAQPRALGGRDCAAHLRAGNHRGHGGARFHSGDQRAQRSGASLPGAGRLFHAAGALRRSAGRSAWPTSAMETMWRIRCC